MEITYSKKGCKKVFKTYKHQVATIQKAVAAQLTQQFATDFAKTKLATRIPVAGTKCYECRVNPPQLPAMRVAFTRHGAGATVEYLTTNITKADFTQELEQFLGGK